jgi:hypothetical protein
MKKMKRGLGLFLSLFLHGAVDSDSGTLSPTEGRLNRPRANYFV